MDGFDKQVIEAMTDEQREHIRAWVKALRSGDYSQATQTLKTSNGHCCLGVACEVFKQETGRGEWLNRPNRGRETFVVSPTQEEIQEMEINPVNHLWEDHMTLPISVAYWLFGNWKVQNPDAKFICEDDGPTCVHGLAEQNDDGMSFAEIADAIERTYL